MIRYCVNVYTCTSLVTITHCHTEQIQKLAYSQLVAHATFSNNAAPVSNQEIVDISYCPVLLSGKSI